MMYNFPGVAGGIDMNSDLIEDIAKSAPNTCGIKLTCVSPFESVSCVANNLSRDLDAGQLAN